MHILKQTRPLQFTDHTQLFAVLDSGFFSPMILGASYLSTHASLAHTPLPPLLRGGTALSEQALPLCRADRGSIWRLMLRKRLIKGGAKSKSPGLITASKASQLLGLIGQGTSGQLLGRDWVIWWLPSSKIAGSTFTLLHFCSR